MTRITNDIEHSLSRRWTKIYDSQQQPKKKKKNEISTDLRKCKKKKLIIFPTNQWVKMSSLKYGEVDSVWFFFPSLLDD